VEYPAVTLRRGLTDDADLWGWFQKGADGKAERRNVSIIQLDDTGVEKVRWNLREALPTKWMAPRFNATGTEVSIEAVEIEHEGLTQVKKG
jgi:phage tail-like protein